MKRLLLASLLCVVAVIVAPVASASAKNPEHVKCKFEGTAVFGAKLTAKPTKTTYKFNSEGTTSNKCKVNNEEPELAAEAEVKGEGNLSCTVSPGLGVAGLATGTGKLKVGTTKPVFEPLKFEFVGTGPVVTFEASGSNTAKEEFVGGGSANFLSTLTALEECAGAGLGSVGFTATSAGVVK
jgi:hypothetical protein